EKRPCPKIVHELFGGGRHAVHAGDDCYQGCNRPQWESEKQRAAGFSFSRKEPFERKVEPDPGHHEHGRLRKPNNEKARDAGECEPLRGSVALEQLQRKERQDNCGKQIALVLLNFSAEPDERHANREKKQRNRRPDGRQDFFRQAPEKKKAGEATNERNQPQRHLVRAKNVYRKPLEEQKSARRDLVQRERFRKEVAQRQLQNVA